MVDNSAELPFAASYEGLALGQNSKGQNVLYAADGGNGSTISNNRFDMFDGAFHSLGSFTDPSVSVQYPGNTAFQVEFEDGRLFVTFGGFTPPFGGVVDVFDTEGNFLHRLSMNGPGGTLEAPFWVTRAPKHFGFASDHLPVTNVEAGTISVFDDGGSFLGNLQDPSGQDIVLIGIWASVFDHGDGNPKMFYSAGCDFPPDSPSLFGYVTIMAPQDK